MGLLKSAFKLISGPLKDAGYQVSLPALAMAVFAPAAVITSDDFTSVGMFDLVSDPVVTMQDGTHTVLAKDFMCRTRTHRCTMDLGDGTLMSFARFGDFQNAKTLIENGLMGSFKGVDIPPEINRAMVAASILTPFSYEHWIGKINTESSFRADAFNESTKARGINQFLPGSALEALYYMHESGNYPFIPEAAQVTRNIVKDDTGRNRYVYGVADGVDKDAFLENILYDPMKSVFISSAYSSRYLQLLDLPEGQDLTSLHEYMLHWQGPGGAQRLYNAYSADPHRDAYTVFADTTSARIIDDNRSMFIKRDGEAFSIEEMLDYISREKGIGNYAIGELNPTLAPPIQIIFEKGTPDMSPRGHAQEIYTARFPNEPPRPIPRPTWANVSSAASTHG